MLFNRFSEKLVSALAGLPIGGAAGYVLTKIDGADYNVTWSPAGGGGSFPPGGDVGNLLWKQSTTDGDVLWASLIPENGIYFSTGASNEVGINAYGGPPGGATGQVLTKYGGFDYEFYWADLPTPGASSPTQTKINLSASPNGETIPVTANSLAGAMTVHTSVSGTTNWDNITIYASNTDTVARILYLQWGANAIYTERAATMLIPANSPPVLVADGFFLNNAKIVKAFGEASNVINLTGYVIRNIV